MSRNRRLLVAAGWYPYCVLVSGAGASASDQFQDRRAATGNPPAGVEGSVNG